MTFWFVAHPVSVTEDRAGPRNRSAVIGGAYPMGFTIEPFDLLQELSQGGFVAGIAGQHFISQRITFRGDHQRNDHLHTVRSLVPPVAKPPLVLGGKGGSLSK